MAEISQRPIPKVPALRGKNVVSLFFEDSTRTRTSFDTAAKRLSADTMNFSVSSSSLNKGESLRDTIETIGDGRGRVRRPSPLERHPAADHAVDPASIVNAGDGWHQHPTQALLDCYTIRTGLDRRDGFDGLRIAIVGDVKRSRVARSDVQAFAALGAHVTLVAPPTLLPPSLDGWPVDVSHDLDALIADLDVLYLWCATSAMDEACCRACASLGDVRPHADKGGAVRAARPGDHPGPMNRGVGWRSTRPSCPAW